MSDFLHLGQGLEFPLVFYHHWLDVKKGIQPVNKLTQVHLKSVKRNMVVDAGALCILLLLLLLLLLPVFTARCCSTVVYAIVVGLSICLCVCPSHPRIVSKWLNIGSRKQCQMTAQGL